MATRPLNGLKCQSYLSPVVDHGQVFVFQCCSLILSQSGMSAGQEEEEEDIYLAQTMTTIAHNTTEQ